MNVEPEQRAALLGEYITEHSATVRAAARAFGCSKFRHFGVRSGIGYVGAGLYTFRIQWFSGYGSRILYSL